MTEDAELLRSYAADKSEAAFAELVRRHINLVYASAVRRVGGDAHLAKDVTQSVFTALAADAAKLSRHPVLAGWLHTTTRFAASQLVRTERRRQAREQEVHTMHESSLTDPVPLADWERLRPLLDEVLDELDARDREAVLLRYFEERSFVEVGTKLRLAENAARMRVERALDKMNALLARRGVTSTVAALTLALASQAGVVAPAGFATTVTGVALSGAVAATTGMTSLTFMSANKIVFGIAGVITTLAIGTVFYQADVNHEALATVRAERDAALTRLRHLEPALQEEKARAETADKDSPALRNAIDKSKVAAGAPAEAPVNAPVNEDTVRARYERAQNLAQNGNWEEALKEFLWLYDEGMVRVASFSGVRGSFLLSDLAKLAAHYPPAMAALHERRDAAEQRMLASETDREAVTDYATLNRELGEQGENLLVYDKLPAGDPRRQSLLVLGGILDPLIAAQRYGDIMDTRTYESMNTWFAMNTMDHPAPAGARQDQVDRQKAMLRKRAVTSTAKDIEVLAGAGKLDNARALAGKLLAYDGSAETRSVIQEHATRAGHPELLTAPSKP